MERKKIAKFFIIITALYFVICILASFWNFFYGPLQHYLYTHYAATYDGKIESILGYDKKEGTYNIYVKGKVISTTDQVYLITITKEYINNPYSTDSEGIKYIHIYKKNITALQNTNYQQLNTDSSVTLYGDRHIRLDDPEVSSKPINIVVKNATVYKKGYHFLKPFAFIIDFLISPFNIRPFVPV